jgi:hypothetical protein
MAARSTRFVVTCAAVCAMLAWATYAAVAMRGTSISMASTRGHAREPSRELDPEPASQRVEPVRRSRDSAASERQAVTSDERARAEAEDLRQEAAIAAGLESRLANEPVDATWAPAGEAHIRASVAELGVPLVAVHCGSTLCMLEVDLREHGGPAFGFDRLARLPQFRERFGGEIYAFFGAGVPEGRVRAWAARENGELDLEQFFFDREI